MRIEISSSGSSPGAIAAANVVSLSSGVSSVSVTFTSAFGSTSYSPDWAIINTVDANPIFLQGYISAMSSSGFTVTFNAATDTANYKFAYKISGFL